MDCGDQQQPDDSADDDLQVPDFPDEPPAPMPKPRDSAVRKIFTLIDADGDGGITLKELKAFAKKQNVDFLFGDKKEQKGEKFKFNQHAARRLLRDMDGNDDKTVDVDEFVRYFTQLTDGLSDAEFEKATEAYSQLSSREVRAGITAAVMAKQWQNRARRTMISWRAKMIKIVFNNQLGADDSGSIPVDDLIKFADCYVDSSTKLSQQGLTRGQRKNARARALRLLDLIDENKDGHISEDEFVSWLTGFCKDKTNREFVETIGLYIAQVDGLNATLKDSVQQKAIVTAIDEEPDPPEGNEQPGDSADDDLPVPDSHDEPLAPMPKPRDSAVRKIFTLIDADGDGGITLKELKAFAKKQNVDFLFGDKKEEKGARYRFNQHAARRLLRDMDGNDDKTGDADEFVRYFTQLTDGLSDAEFEKATEAYSQLKKCQCL
jgi:Ca2+-binding EF-hand superfamily protein